MGWLLLLILHFPIGAFAQLGNDAGGGGNAVVCRASAGEIISAEVLDLFEARAIHRLVISKSALPAAEQAEKLLDEGYYLNPAAFPDRMLEDLLSITRVLDPQFRLEPVEDSFPILGQKGCKIEQLARYLSTEELLIDGEIWARLDETNKAALYLHEGLYREQRLSGAKNSRRARRIVGYLFADSSLLAPVQVPRDLPLSYRCESAEPTGTTTSFSVSLIRDEEGSEDAKLYFLKLAGRSLISQTNALARGAKIFSKPAKGDRISLTTTSDFEWGSAVALEVVKVSKGAIIYRAKIKGRTFEEDGQSNTDYEASVRCVPR